MSLERLAELRALNAVCTDTVFREEMERVFDLAETAMLIDELGTVFIYERNYLGDAWRIVCFGARFDAPTLLSCLRQAVEAKRAASGGA